MKTIALLNQKGGVGKTTTAVNTAAALDEKGHRSLVVDLDAQMNATSWLFQRLDSGDPSIFESLDSVDTPEEADFSFQNLVKETAVHLVPSNKKMRPDNFGPAIVDDGPYPFQLSTRIQELEADAEDGRTAAYEFCLLDCPPSLSRSVVVALTASDSVIVPVVADKFSMEGLRGLTELISTVREYYNDGLSIMGLLPNNLDRRSGIVNEVEDRYRETYEERVFETAIPWRSKINEAGIRSQTVFEFAPSSESADFYRQLADEVIERD